jgi:signal peptidase II
VDRTLRKRLPFYVFAILVLAVDLVSKSVAFDHAETGRIIWVFGRWFGIAEAWNTGVTGGMGKGVPPILLTLSAGVLAAGVALYMRYGKKVARFHLVGLALILGGALGNLYDRIAFGAVRDFIDVWFRLDWGFSWLHHWPTFNVADAAIVTGVLILLLWPAVQWVFGKKGES